MKTLTNESKKLFFAHHYPLSAEYINGQTFNVNGASLPLTPLQNISDEHANYLIKLEMSTWSVSEYEKVIIDGNFIYFTPIFFHNSNKIYNINLNKLRFDQHKYLQSKSYAIDWFCPIENRIIPVQEQIDNGWITLKTQ